jgi:hypothetical protein
MTNEHEHEPHGGHEHHEHGEHDGLFIHIDHKKYHPEHHHMKGEQIRQLAKPPITAEYDLWLETPGPGDDEKIGDQREVHLKHRMSFYSVLRHIDPGATDGTH